MKISLRKFHEDLADRAKNTQEATDSVLSKCLTQLSTPARLRLPPLDHVKRTIRHHRKENNLPNIPNDVDFPSVPTTLQFTKRNEIFLRIDTGAGDFGSNAYLQRSMFALSTEFLIDGTFDIVPEIFYQLYVSHAVHCEYVIPAAFCLLRRKNEITYQDMLNKIMEFAPTWNPENLLMDFEKALSMHFRQFFHKHLSLTQGLQKKYEDYSNFANGIHKIAALAFINPKDVVKAFVELSLHLDDQFQSMLDYFEDNYIGRFPANGSRARPLFGIKYWNVYDRTKNSQMRTNNSAEAWNRRISKYMITDKTST
ncbi:unnamed protein product [Rotaria sp. Silwood2]|nr:unnamed protein product [Rotaria sp. Silwood2]CAF4487883.1 unnamed protein product [Rotaria sp. Silwood2]